MENKLYKCLWKCKYGKDNLCCFSCKEECPDRCQDPIDFCEVNDDKE